MPIKPAPVPLASPVPPLPRGGNNFDPMIAEPFTWPNDQNGVQPDDQSSYMGARDDLVLPDFIRNMPKATAQGLAKALMAGTI